MFEIIGEVIVDNDYYLLYGHTVNTEGREFIHEIKFPASKLHQLELMVQVYNWYLTQPEKANSLHANPHVCFIPEYTELQPWNTDEQGRIVAEKNWLEDYPTFNGVEFQLTGYKMYKIQPNGKIYELAYVNHTEVKED